MERKVKKLKYRPVLRMLKRMLEHAKTREELDYLWSLALDLLSREELRVWLIRVKIEYQFSLPSERIIN